MKISNLVALCFLPVLGRCDTSNRQPLTYAAIPDGTYVPPKNSGITTLLDLVQSRSDLSTLSSILVECGGLYTSERLISLQGWREHAERMLILAQGFCKHLILHRHGPTHSSPPPTRHSTTLENTTPHLLQRQRESGGLAT
jgi:hypothetical protein